MSIIVFEGVEFNYHGSNLSMGFRAKLGTHVRARAKYRNYIL